MLEFLFFILVAESSATFRNVFLYLHRPTLNSRSSFSLAFEMHSRVFLNWFVVSYLRCSNFLNS